MNRWQRIKTMRATCCNTVSALWAQRVSMHFVSFSVHTPIARTSMKNTD